MSKYTEYISALSVSESFKSDLYTKTTSAQPVMRKKLGVKLKAAISVSAAAILALAIVLPLALNNGNNYAARRYYAKVFANIAEAVFESGKESGISPVDLKLSVGINIGVAGSSILNEDEVIPLKFTEPKDNSTLYGVAANVYFYSQLYLNDNYIISDLPVGFSINDINSYYYVNGKPFESKINYDVILQSSIDRENGIVTSQMIIYEEQFWQGFKAVQNYDYINLYAEYDFDTDEVVSYTASSRSVSNGNVSYNCYRYFDNFLTELDVSVIDGDYRIFTEGMDSLQAEFEAKGEQVIKLDADFKEEFIRSTSYYEHMLKRNNIY